MPTNRLPEDDQTRKTLEKLLIRLTWIEELAVDAYIVVLAFGLWVFAAPFYAVLWITLCVSYRIWAAVAGIDRWSQLRKERR